MVDPGYSSFVRKDYEILRKRFSVRQFHYQSTKNPIGFAIQMTKTMFASLRFATRSDLVFIWFADYHSLFPALIGRLTGRKVVVVTGGFDAVAIPQLSYGVFVRKNFRYWCAASTYRFANLILPVDGSLAAGFNHYAGRDGIALPVGVRQYVPGIRGRIEVLPTGYDPAIWKRDTTVDRKPSVLTVAYVNKEQTFRLKGFDLLIETARLLPDTIFTLAGISPEMQNKYRDNLPSNVRLLGPIAYHDLPALYSNHQVYAQLSLSEGLPNSLCEAMLCECVPVGSQVNGIPAAIGNTGYLLQKHDAAEAAILITKALISGDEPGKAARAHIMRNFPEKRREVRLTELLNEIL